MTGKKKSPQPYQQPLWMLPITPEDLELPATKQQQLRTALADLLWQFANTPAELEATKQQGGYDGHDERQQDHA